VIDAYLGVGMTPVELAESMKISSSRVSQLFRAVCERIGIHMGHQAHQRSIDRAAVTTPQIEELIALRELELARASDGRAWGELMEEVLASPDEARISVSSTTRWG
jgi:RNA polymerase sigma factor for flagellar operon FliA